MKVNDPNLSSLGAAPQNTNAAAKSQQTGQSPRSAMNGAPVQAPGDDIHLSELVQSLRSLTADSPERQARIEQIARSYANGTYKVNTEGTASKIIDDAFQS